MNVPRVVIAGLYTEGGKTTVATGVMGAFMKKGLKVQAFKVGPDQIDATYHTAVTGKHSRYLDTWLTSPRAVLEIFENVAKNADVAVIEGGMGLFDGITWLIDGVDDYGSTSQIAKILRTPVILVLDFYSMRSHVAAITHNILHALKRLYKQVEVKGVVLNNVTDQQKAEWIRKAIELATKTPVIGVIPHNTEILLPSIRGGLVPITEGEMLKTTFSKLVGYVGEHIDTEKVYGIAQKAEELPDIGNRVHPSQETQNKVRLGVAFDEAFSFYNQDNIDLLEAYGAEIVLFSPIHDKELPTNLDGLYFSGGFPDRWAEQLTTNQIMRKNIKDQIDDGMPTYSEHGGSMYLTKSITNLKGCKFPMVGSLSGKALMERRLQALNSTLMETINDNLLSQIGTVIHSREFHFSKIIDFPKDVKFAYKMRIGKGIDGEHDGLMENKMLALLGHLHFAFKAKFAENFIKHSEQYKRR